MKKSTLLVFALWAFSLAAQVKVGDNPTTINPAAALEIESTDKGLLPPRMTTAQRDAIASPPTGLIVFNTSVGCLQINQGVPATPDWICIGEAGVTVTIDCNTNGFSGTYTEGEALTTQTLSVTVTNTSFSQADINFNVANVTLSGVSGISVTGVSPASASLSTAGASQLVTYTLSGTPTSFGTLTAAVDIAGILTCNTSVTVISASDAVLAQIGNEADDPDNVNSVVTVAQLNTITPALTGVTAGNEAAYQEYIDANPNAFSNPATQPEVQAMITAVNTSQSVLAQIGNEGDDPDVNPSVVTVAQLNTITPALTGVTVGNETAYQEYIDANPNAFSNPATQPEVQAMITAVNTSQSVLAQIGNEGDDPDVVPSVVTVAQLNTITPSLTGVTAGNETAYQEYIDANPNAFSNPATQPEVQAMITSVNANQTLLANIGTDADNGNNALTAGVTAADFNALPGVSGATVANEAAYLAYIAANANAFSAPATTSEVQAMITAVNASQTVLAQIGNEGDDPDVNPSVVTVAQLNTITPALTGVTAGNETAYQAYIDANPADFSSPATQPEVQAMINAVNANPTGIIPGNATCASATISATPCTASELSSGINGGSLGNKYNNGAGGTYSVVEINGQCWMQENIDVNPTSSPAWVNITDNGWYGYYNNTYQAADEGTLMQWSAAMNGSTTERAQGVCPTGWHVPSDCEWMYLENSLGMTTAEQQVTGYRGSEGQDLSTLVTGGTNSSGFTALLAGFRSTDGTFSHRGTYGSWWSSSESSATNAHSRALSSSQAGVHRGSGNKALGLSVRCLKD